MKRTALIFNLCLIPFLLQACVPVTYTAYNANRYRLGRTLGKSQVHFTGSLGSAPFVQDAGELTGIESTVHSDGGVLFGEFGLGIFDRTDITLGGGYGSGTCWSFSLQQQLTSPGKPFALSIAPGMTFIDGPKSTESDYIFDWDNNSSSSTSAWIDSRMTVTELRVPMSYRFTQHVELLWGAGLLCFDHRADYGNSEGTNRHLIRSWVTPLGSLGIRLGFFSLESTVLSFDGKSMATLGGAARVHF